MQSISHFPKFEKLKLSHKYIVEQIICRYNPYSDYNFTSLWTYDTQEQIELTLLNDNLVIRFQDYITNKPFYSFIGKKKSLKTIDILLSHSLKRGYKAELKLMPEEIIDQSLHTHFKIIEDHDNHDYILSAVELSDLKGKKYYDKRNLVNRFKKKYPNYVVRKINLTQKSIQTEIIELFLLWEKQAKRDQKDTENELKAINRLLAHAHTFHILGIGIYNSNQLVGFATYELTHKKYGIISFEKGNRHFDGIYSVLNHEVAKDLLKKGFVHINYEQDLGIDGLKKAKTLWRPIHFLKKYRITPK